jgi:hypothetical protein
VAVSPTVVDASALPCDNHDEWYVFPDHVPECGSPELFVSYGGFSPEPIAEADWDETWDPRARREIEALQDRFWAALHRFNPWLYVADGDLLTLVTKSEADRNRASERLVAMKV